MQLSIEEAENIYEKLVDTEQTSEFLGFESAWGAFKPNEQSPLMEFIYLLKQGEALHERILEQIRNLEDEESEVINKIAIDFLRIVSIATAYGARLNLPDLVNKLSHDNPRRLVERLEKEYFIKIDESSELVDGVHPLRSLTIKNILVNEFSSWRDDLDICLACMYEQDLATFLFELFVRETRSE